MGRFRVIALAVAFIMAFSLFYMPAERASASIRNPVFEDLNHIGGEYWSDILFYGGDGIQRDYLAEISTGFWRIKADDSGVTVIKYDNNFNRVSSKSVTKELSETKGFYEGEQYYYLFFSAYNPNESDSKEVFRIVKYDKNWNRLGAASLRGQNAVNICGYGLDAAEYGGYLFVHTDHTMYKLEDGLNHEGNILFKIRISDMSCLESTGGAFMCSHSFAQYITIDDDANVAILNKGDYTGAEILGTFGTPATGDNVFNSYNKNVLIKNPYSGGDGVWGFENYVYLGGLEYSNSTYLTAGSSLKLDSNWENNEVSNVFITVTQKQSGTSTIKWLTSYSEGSTTSAGKPFLKKIGANRFLVIWSQQRTQKSNVDSYSISDKGLVYDNSGFTETGTLSYMIIDGNGNTVQSRKNVSGYLSDCEPILSGDHLVWFYTPYGGPTVFCDLDTASGDIQEYTNEEKKNIEDVYIDSCEDMYYYGGPVEQDIYLYADKRFGEELKEGTDYTISYENNVNVGTAKVIIRGINDYTGTVIKTFNIIPGWTYIKSLRGKKKAVTVKWKKQAQQTNGYQIQYSRKKNFKSAKTITIKNNKTVSKKIKKLKSKKKYYVRIRTFKTVSGKNYYSEWSDKKSVKTR